MHDVWQRWYHTGMKLNLGSIQRRGHKLYLVLRIENKSKWVSLKTNNLNIARKRARKLLPPEDSERSWLMHLARLGSNATAELRKRDAMAKLTWQNLWDEFLSKSTGTLTSTSEISYERWMRILSDTADTLGLTPNDIIKNESCAKITAKLLGAYVSARRILGFYRRVWRTLGLDPRAWECDHVLLARSTSGRHKFYRRLTMGELRKIHRYLKVKAPDLADMVVIGYSTGLRLSDVAELDIGEIEAEGRFLSVVPNKTRTQKPVPLRIPLTNQARDILLRRRKSITDGSRYIFSEDVRNRPTRKIAAAFRSCGVLAVGNGRASFHSLRATFISMMDEAGIPPHITDAITGHAGGDMHSRYSQPSSDALRNAIVRAIPPL